ncbi:helix-turn-helix domain-containing protein [Paracoccus wurundjeri]|uniref:helix-turn-helix domain-containing protein n=1 Tax=Paracoccus onubensis TaxID=1675788 RepID=UPI003F9479D5
MIQKQDFPAVAESTDRAGRPAPQQAQDVTLYTRHIGEGVPIRALARELGCHASTVLRRIRRFEERRDDPLIDSALSAQPGQPLDEKKLRQVLRRLVEPGAVLATTDGIETAIVTRDDIRTAVLGRDMAETMALRGWIAQTRSVGRI